MRFFLALCTAGSEKEGRRIGKSLVDKGLAACVNVIPGITSLFFWQGKLCKEKEVILLIKTTERNKEEIIDHIKKLHAYAVPEILFFRIDEGDKKYLDWVQETVEGKRIRSKKIIDSGSG